MCHQRLEVGNIPRVVLPRALLQPLCAGFQLLLRIGSPPREVGVT